jgi:hypothetical protein
MSPIVDHVFCWPAGIGVLEFPRTPKISINPRSGSRSKPTPWVSIRFFGRETVYFAHAWLTFHGSLMPVKNSGIMSGSVTASFSSALASSSEAISANVTCGRLIGTLKIDTALVHREIKQTARVPPAQPVARKRQQWASRSAGNGVGAMQHARQEIPNLEDPRGGRPVPADALHALAGHLPPRAALRHVRFGC